MKDTSFNFGKIICPVSRKYRQDNYIKVNLINENHLPK